MGYVMILLAAGVVFGLLGSHVARAKGRSGDEGLVFGFLLGPIGLLVLALMPSAAPPVARAPSEAEPDEPARPAAKPRSPAVSDRDDVAMDFTMELIRQAEKEKPSIPRVPPRGLSKIEGD